MGCCGVPMVNFGSGQKPAFCIYVGPGGGFLVVRFLYCIATVSLTCVSALSYCLDYCLCILMFGLHIAVRPAHSLHFMTLSILSWNVQGLN